MIKNMGRQPVRPRALAHFTSNLQELVQDPGADSLHLLLETAGARATWLAHRYASAALEQSTANVILVTWSQSSQFWSNELRKSANIDVDKLLRSHNLIILDQFDLLRASPLGEGQDFAETIHTGLNMIIKSLPADRSALMVLDSPDLLLGLENVPTTALLWLILEIRSIVKSTIILTASNIFATSSHDTGASPLQLRQQQFLTTLIHQADAVMATRVLDTGQAKDVSGVLRVTRGSHPDQPVSNGPFDREYLYHVDASRTARIWQRGAER